MPTCDQLDTAATLASAPAAERQNPAVGLDEPATERGAAHAFLLHLQAVVCSTQVLVLLMITTIYAAVTLLLAEQKLLWSDEFFTLYLARLPELSTLWEALSTGGDQHPPLFYMMVRVSLWLFGENEIGLRIPSIIGFWVMCLSLYIFVARRTTPAYGLLAALVPAITQAYWYAYEARGYALMLGFTGLALVCWQAAAERRHRKWAVPALVMSLAAAVGSHYYAVLVTIPLAMGELVRTYSTRRINYWVWFAFGGVLIPLLAFLPIIRSARGFSEHFWAKPKWIDLLSYPQSLLGWGITPLIICLVVIAVRMLLRPSEFDDETPRKDRQLPAAEVVVAIGLLASPIVAMVLAKTVTSGFHLRYSLYSVEGWGILFAFVAYRLLSGRAAVGTAIVVTLQCWFMATALLSVGWEYRSRAGSQLMAKRLQAGPRADLPLVFGKNELWYRYTYYNHDGIAERAVYLADPDKSIQFIGHDTVDRCALTLEPWFKLPVEPYGAFIKTHEEFLVYTNLNSYWHWQTTGLLEDNLRLEVLARDGQQLLLLVSRPPRRTTLDASPTTRFDAWAV